MNLLAAKVEIAVLEPDFLGIFGLARDRHRELCSRRLNLDFPGDQLDFPRRELGVQRFRRTGDHLSGDRHDRLQLEGIEQLLDGIVLIGDDLGDSVMVAQVDEEHAAMIPLPMDPAGNPDFAPDVGSAELAAIVGAIRVHVSADSDVRKFAAALTGGKAFVNPRTGR